MVDRTREGEVGDLGLDEEETAGDGAEEVGVLASLLYFSKRNALMASSVLAAPDPVRGRRHLGASGSAGGARLRGGGNGSSSCVVGSVPA